MTIPQADPPIIDRFGAILIQGLHDAQGNGYFRAWLETEAGPDNQPLPSATLSTSRKGVFLAAANLCKRLEKHAGQIFDAIPAKWRLFLIAADSTRVPLLHVGHLRISDVDAGELFIASAMAPPGSGTDTLTIDRLFDVEPLNAVEDAFGQTGFGALANLLRKFHYHRLAETLDAIVLDTLTASFFLPTANKLDEEDE